MDQEQLLPRGFVVNSSTVNQSIESIAANPMDPADIAELWKVFTTTKRRLLDPTAERLENHWWRIWGSRRRELKGATVARLFAQISDGQSFVPLRGPTNRDEGDSLPRNARHGPSSVVNFGDQNSDRPSTTSSSTASKAPAQMPHPILKKSRGPSTGGPRPTARFISPHDSEDEGPSPISPNSHVVVQPPSPDPESQTHKADKKSSASGNGNGKRQGFVASKKKRPAIVRRKSSQSSNENAKGADGQGTVRDSSSERTPPSLAEPAEVKAKRVAKSHENRAPTSERSPKKRFTPKSGEGKRTSAMKPSARKDRFAQQTISDYTENGDPGPSTLQRLENSQASSEELTSEELEELEMQRILLAEANARMQEGPPPEADSVKGNLRSNARQSQRLQTQNRSASEGNLSLGANRYLSHGNKSATILAPTLTDATGEMELGGDATIEPTRATSRRTGKGKGKDLDQHTTDLFAKIPVQPSTGAVVDTPSSLARSKSQLTLLLEKDRARSGEHNPKDDKKKGK